MVLKDPKDARVPGDNLEKMVLLVKEDQMGHL